MEVGDENAASVIQGKADVDRQEVAGAQQEEEEEVEAPEDSSVVVRFEQEARNSKGKSVQVR